MPLDAYLRAVETPLRETFFPLGRAVAVESNDPLIMEYARMAFGHFPPVVSPEEPIRLRLLRDLKIEGSPPWPAAVFRNAADLWVVACGGNVAVADLKRKYVAGYFSAAMLADKEFFHWTFLTAVVYSILVRHNFTPMHASCVVREGAGLCLCGPSGSGKTTLAYYCARNGYQLLAEDAVYVTRDANPRLRGDARYFHFNAEARQLFPELVQWPVSLIRNGQECLVVSSKELGITSLAGDARPGGLVFLDRGGKPGLKRLPARQAFQLLYDEVRLDDDKTMQAHRRALKRLVRGGSYRLGYSQPAEALELLNRIPGAK